MAVRKPKDEADLRYWLENMVWYHHFGDEEISRITGLTLEECQQARAEFNINVNNRPPRQEGAPLMVLPYPGGRHPRIGFLEGAIDPQRETKFSVFAPWDPFSYVVVDVPEAIFCNLGLLYLAHTHVPTLWTKQNITLEPLEWTRLKDGGLEIERTLPNKVSFGVRVTPTRTEVRMELWLTNGTDQPLTDLRVQNCVLFRGASGFEHRTGENKVHASPFVACRASNGKQWVITTWEPVHRVWDNPPCPCMHSDPILPDCAPGQTTRARGWLSFFEGPDVQPELRRIAATNWASTGSAR
jgi:hypothetical protein